MEILWPALGISAIVVFVFYILAQHWQRMLRHQNWTIGRLVDRVRDLEEMADPEFRRRLSDSAPMPLEQVFTLTFRLSDRFWRDALHTTEEDREFIHEFGSFVGSVKLERWRSHTVATITEVLPDRKETGWHTRTLDYYPDAAKNGNGLVLWELALARRELSAERPPSLELVLRANSLELAGYLGHAPAGNSGNGHGSAEGLDRVVFFRAPLDTAQLAEFRSHDPLESDYPGAEENGSSGGSWHAFYSGRNEELGVEWQLRLRDLSKKAEWERWKILESAAMPLATREK